MESINNMAQAAAKAVWGTSESKEEPISGKTGDTAKGEPYDAGNMEPRTTTGATGSDSMKPADFSSTAGADDDTTTGGDNYTTSSDKFRSTGGNDYLPTRDSEYNKPASDFTSGVTDNKTTDLDDNNTTSSDNLRSTGGSDYLPTREKEYNNKPTSDFSSGATDSNKPTNTRSEKTEEDTTTSSSSAGPHKEFGSSIKPSTDMSKAQQDVRDPSDPKTDPKTSQIRSNVDDSTDGPDTGDNPDKVDGPGPKPIEEVAKKFGGDAGNAKPERRAGEEGKDDDEEESGDGPQKTSHGSGTGEQYVKSTGLKADGGDFDATKPGAGREADRLLEEKGVHREVGTNKPTTVDDDAEGAEGKEKKSLGEKIKAKLHKPHLKH